MREGGGRTIDERVRKVFISILRNRCEVNGGYSDAQCHFDDDDLACIQREFGMTKSRARGVLSRFRNSFDVHERREALAQGLWCRPREVEEDAKAKGRTMRVVWEHQPVLAKALLEQCRSTGDYENGCVPADVRMRLWEEHQVPPIVSLLAWPFLFDAVPDADNRRQTLEQGWLPRIVIGTPARRRLFNA